METATVPLNPIVRAEGMLMSLTPVSVGGVIKIDRQSIPNLPKEEATYSVYNFNLLVKRVLNPDLTIGWRGEVSYFGEYIDHWVSHTNFHGMLSQFMDLVINSSAWAEKARKINDRRRKSEPA